jgi:uncharacterized protein YkwD
MRPVRRNDAARTACLSLIFLAGLILLACGVPISASEMTATAETGESTVADVSIVTQASSRSAGLQTLQAEGTAGPLATPLLSGTPAPLITGTPAAAATSQATIVAGTPLATGTVLASGTPAATATPNASFAQQALVVLNQQRAARGLKALTVNPTLTAAATAYAKLMADRDTFGHTGPDGSTPQSRLLASGYKGSYKGEALAAGQNTPQAAIDTWRDSAAHAAIIYEATSVDVGIGYYFQAGDYYGHYWVFMAGAP